MQYSFEHIDTVPDDHIDALSHIDTLSSHIVVFFIPW
jgi:hypothetical protein